PVRPRAGVIMRQVIPCVAVGAVVLADRSPLPLADVRTPPVPVACLQQSVFQLAEAGDPVRLRTHGVSSEGHRPVVAHLASTLAGLLGTTISSRRSASVPRRCQAL